VGVIPVEVDFVDSIGHSSGSERSGAAECPGGDTVVTTAEGLLQIAERRFARSLQMMTPGAKGEQHDDNHAKDRSRNSGDRSSSLAHEHLLVTRPNHTTVG
jgi:hypothetical protein